MGYPPPPPPPGTPGGYGPPPGAPGYGPPPGSPPPGAPGGYGGPPPGYTPSPTGGPAPGAEGSKGPLIALMAALVVVVLIAVVGGLVLLSRDGGGDVELTEAQLRDALVTAGDVGEGFTAEDDDDDDEPDDFDRDEIDASQECIDLYEEIEVSGGADADVEADVTFGAEDGSSIEQSLSQGSDVGLDTVREFVDTCGEISIDDGEQVGTLRFEIVDDLVEVGDDSITLQIEIDIDEPFDITATSIGVLWERDGVNASISAYGPVDEATFEVGDPDERLLADVVERADERLAEVIDEA